VAPFSATRTLDVLKMGLI